MERNNIKSTYFTTILCRHFKLLSIFVGIFTLQQPVANGIYIKI